MGLDQRDDVRESIASELSADEQVCAVLPPTGSTGLFIGAGSHVAVVATDRRLIFVERFMTGTLRPLQDVPISEVRVEDGIVGRVMFAILAQLRLQLPEGLVTLGNIRYRSDARKLRSLIASTNA